MPEGDAKKGEGGTRGPSARWKPPGPDHPMWEHADQMWRLDLADIVEGYSWWWWWYLLFLDPPDRDSDPRQLMILYSTKNCDWIYVNDHLWRRKGEIVETGDGYRFNGMTACWYYDGRNMHDPLVLEENQFRVLRKGGAPDHLGQLLPRSVGDYSISGKRDDYRLNIRNDEVDFRFRFTPYNEAMTTHRYHANDISGKLGYDIYKRYGMRTRARMVVKGDGDPSSREGYHRVHSPVPPGRTEHTQGTVYFQKLRVNGPPPPWFWGLFHMDDGSFVDYMIPHLGLDMFRRHRRARSPLDNWKIPLRRNMEFYDAEQEEQVVLPKTTVKRTYREGKGFGNKLEPLPTFYVRSYDSHGRELSMKLEAYSRACWSFEQPWMKVLRTKLFYNEYPSRMLEFKYKGLNGHKITRDRWDTVHGNTEYSWGFLL